MLAAQRMKEALERIDSATLFIVAGEEARAEEMIETNTEVFEHELAVEEANITELGEHDAARRLREGWRLYRRRVDELRAQSPEARKALYFSSIEPQFTAVKDAATEVLDINQDAMVRKSDAARRSSQELSRLVVIAAVIAGALGLFASTYFTARALRPLAVLRLAMRRAGSGDLAVRANIDARDEIGELASDFNVMADHLEQYRKSSLGELLLAQRAAQAVIDSLSDPVIVVGLRGEVMSANTAAETLLRVALEKTDPLEALDVGVRSAIERMRAHVAAGKGAYVPRGLEEAVRTATADGERWLLPRATPLYGEEGGISGVTIVLQEVTRLLRFDELKNNLVATVAHEFRTPLTSLRMAIHLLVEGTVGPTTRKQADLLYAAREECERMQNILDDLLDLSRIQSGKIELHRRRVSAESLVTTAIAGHRAPAEEKGVLLRSEVLPGVGETFADPDRLDLVFSNLLGNAIRFTPAGSEVVVRARPVEGTLRFEVTDSGPGIPVEHQAQLFEKFFRVPGAPSGGVGLGLFICKEIVIAHGGTIGVISTPGQGATFWFELPLAPETGAGAAA